MGKKKENGTPDKSFEVVTGPQKGDFLTPPEFEERDERADALPAQEEFWKPPTRFGSIPVEKEPLGWDRRRGFRKLFLHVMRQLPSESIDVIFGDQNELRSFSDIWEGGMPGYLVWLNARLYEMKRLLKKTGSIYVHCDWHAVHYVKVEMDKIFGVGNFINEIVWCYSIGGKSNRTYGRKHDVIFFCGKTKDYFFNPKGATVPRKPNSHMKVGIDTDGREYQEKRDAKSGKVYRYYLDDGKVAEDYWIDIETINREDAQRIGYPTQKPEKLLERVIMSSCPEHGVVADFYTGGGTTAAVAQRLGRRWIACDQSRVAVAITADRLTRQVEEQTGRLFPVPDFTVEHWGVYEARRLADAPPEQFRAFVLKCFGAVAESSTDKGSTGVSPVDRSMGVSPVDRSMAVSPVDRSMAVSPVDRSMAVPAMNHGRDAHATTDAHATLNIRKGARLPHWTMDGATYAVTFRLGDSLPKKVLDAWLFERENIVKTAEQMGRPLSPDEEKRLDYLHSEKVGKYLDAGHGACWMKEDRIARIVADALEHFNGDRYDLAAWCVMPNHVHVVAKPYAGHELPDIVHSWKSFTAHEANKVLKRKGQFWEEEYYDHLIRDEADYIRCVEYVLANPEKAGLKEWKWVGMSGECSTGVPPVENHGRDGHATSDHGRDGHATSNHSRDARATSDHGRDARATSDHGRDGHATSNHGRDARATSDHGRDGHATSDHGRDGHATLEHGRDARATTNAPATAIHGYKGAIPVWVGEPKQSKGATAADVQAFANAMRKTLRYKQDNLRDGIMLAWAFRPDAMEAADRLRRLEHTDLNFIRLDTIRIDSPRFREHVTALSTHNADYENFLTFVQPPKVEVGYKRISTRTFKFDVSETVVMNSGAKIINVQWDFDYGKRFSSTPGYSFVRGSKKEVALGAQYEFPSGGQKRIACKVQDDMGGEGLWTAEIEVS